jgi:hypothetical protein
MSAIVSFFHHVLDGLGGTVHGSFFRASSAVQLHQKPGTTGLENPWVSLLNYLNLTFFFYSPNVVWFLQAACLWKLFPYDTTTTTTTLEQGGDDNDATNLLWWTIFRNRFLFTLAYVYFYFGFWHGALYHWNWSNRPFVEHRTYSWAKVKYRIFHLFQLLMDRRGAFCVTEY